MVELLRVQKILNLVTRVGFLDDEEEVMATTLQLPVIQPFSVTSDQMTLGQRVKAAKYGIQKP